MPGVLRSQAPQGLPQVQAGVRLAAPVRRRLRAGQRPSPPPGPARAQVVVVLVAAGPPQVAGVVGFSVARAAVQGARREAVRLLAGEGRVDGRHGVDDGQPQALADGLGRPPAGEEFD